MKVIYHHRVASRDGQFVHIEEIIRSLRKLGHQVNVVAPKVPESGGESSHEGGIVSWLKEHIPSLVYEILEMAYALMAFVRLFFACIKQRPDVIYERYNIFLPSGIWVSQLLSIPLVLEVNAPLFEERGKYDGIALRRLARWTENFVWKNASHVVAVTEVLKGIIVEQGVDPDRVTVISNGVDTSVFLPPKDLAEAKKKLGLPDCLVLGFTGYMREWHGLERVLEVMRDLPVVTHFMVVGDGPARDTLERRAKELGLEKHLTVTGVVPRELMASHIDAFDLALQPRVVRYASPLKLFEYMAMGKAILAPDTSNIREVVRHGENALLFTDDATFEAELVKLCTDDGLREHLGSAARETIFAEKRRWDDNGRTTTEIFQSLIDPVAVDA